MLPASAFRTVDAAFSTRIGNRDLDPDVFPPGRDFYVPARHLGKMSAKTSKEIGRSGSLAESRGAKLS